MGGCMHILCTSLLPTQQRSHAACSASDSLSAVGIFHGGRPRRSHGAACSVSTAPICGSSAAQTAALGRANAAVESADWAARDGVRGVIVRAQGCARATQPPERDRAVPQRPSRSSFANACADTRGRRCLATASADAGVEETRRSSSGQASSAALKRAR
ncbi:hypothetical protein FA09DRAFT_260439 [Tilletiopsis washingtonensis]|uniref:Uncharacterized protein n=1 Tax=Tilletiopsis washingtonensis TaxID=58919 RepID=A0A316ZBF2_9BASI|nr:hypothetical protein FA09DRAFT_260439 [Tilletiopsis washingtonensis]PWN98358.1 hypothetical protein FA09DRAFT_260439 [Tilletiopsis washingtonensis]